MEEDDFGCRAETREDLLNFIDFKKKKYKGKLRIWNSIYENSKNFIKLLPGVYTDVLYYENMGISWPNEFRMSWVSNDDSYLEIVIHHSKLSYYGVIKNETVVNVYKRPFDFKYIPEEIINVLNDLDSIPPNYTKWYSEVNKTNKNELKYGNAYLIPS